MMESLTKNGSAPSTDSRAEPAKANGAAAPAATADWRSNLIPEDLRKDTLWDRFKDPGSVFKSYKELTALQSKSFGKVPDETSTPEERQAFNAKIGVPEKADGYKFQRPEGVPIDENLESWYRKAAFENGIPKAAAEKLYAGFVEQAQGLLDNAASQVSKFKDELKQDWGYATDRNVRIAGNTLGHLIALSGGTPDQNHPLVKFLNETHLGDHPALIRFFHALAPKFGEDQLIESDTGPTNSDVASAKEEKLELMKKGSAYWKGDKGMVARVAQLNEVIGMAK